MRGHNTTTRSMALALAFLLTVFNLPLSAAGSNASATVGSVNSVGSVQLRGVALSNEGTLFSGDRLTVGPGSYARAIVGMGHKIEVGANSDVVVSRDGNDTSLQMTSGNIGIRGNGKGAIHVRIGLYDVTASPDVIGNISYVGRDAFDIRITGGSANVRNTKTKQSYVVQKGADRLISLTTGSNVATMSQLASAVPAAVPAPALPRRQASSWGTGTLIGVVAAAATGTALVTYFLAHEDDEDSAQQTKALSNLIAVAQTAAATSAVAAQSASVAAQASAAINASNLSTAAKASLQAQVNTVTSQANSAAQKIAAINAKISALQTAIANQPDGPTDAQKNEFATLLNDLSSARADANNAIGSLNALLSSATSQGVSGLPQNPNLQPVGQANVASASLPL